MKSKAGMIIIWVVSFALSGCGSHDESAHIGHAPNGDLQETTASVDVLPSFLDKHSEDMRLIYEMAGKSADLLQWIPCYCGCGEAAGHTSNKNCFVREIKEDGSVVWDDHGTRCNICLDIAVQSVQMKMSGMTDLEIRSAIDEAYGKGYAAPTDTPMPTM